MVTHPKKLRTGQAVWQAYPAPAVPHRPLRSDRKADVLIIGAGITGAMVGEAVAAAGLKTIIADKRPPLKGATAASTALVQYEIDTPLLSLAKKIGKADAIRAWRRSRLAVVSLAARLRELGLRDMQRHDALYLAGTSLDAEELRREAQARNAAGLNTLYLTRGALKERFGIARAAALLGYDNIAVNPREMTARLLCEALDQGAEIYSPAEIVDIDCGRTRIVATARAGQTIRCRHLVFATGYELPKDMPKNGHRISSTWAIATVRQKRKIWPEACLIWEASQPYLYLRTTSDGRVICGGEDEKLSDEKTRDALLARKTKILQRKLAKLLPHIDPAIAFAWTASFGESATGLPTIGEIPGRKNCWAALGYGGNGITYSRIAAEILRTAFTGGTDPDADLYTFES